jgi:ribosomal protein S18 acetylase RimI-like enzyme
VEGGERVEPKERIEAIEGNLLEAWEFLSGIPDAQFHKGPKLTRYIGGIPFPLCNSILRADFSAGALDGQVGAAMAPILSRRLPLMWWIGPITKPAGLGRQLDQKGLIQVEDTPGMAIDLAAEPQEPPCPPGLTVRELENGDDLAAWMGIFGTGFEMPEVAIRFFENAIGHFGFGPKTPYRHFLGLWKGEPAACSSVFFGRNASGIYNVATLPAFRGMGIGARMTCRPMRMARERGYAMCILHSSAMGQPLYEQLGFREYCRLAVYLYRPPPQES